MREEAIMDRNNENTRLNTIPSEVYDAAKTQENNISFAKVKINEPEVKEEEALPDEANTQEIKPKKKEAKWGRTFFGTKC